MHKDGQHHVVTIHQGTNADLIAQVARLYLPEGALVADVTYGKGVFWRKCNTSRFTLVGSDLHMDEYRRGQLPLFTDHTPRLLAADFRALPYHDRSIDVLVLDPPYLHNPGGLLMNARYRNDATTRGMYHADILRELYCRGIQEAHRVLKPGGQLWVKGKDEIESGAQCWSHAEIRQAAERCGFRTKDQLLLQTTSTLSTMTWEGQRQLHARKNHSFLWVFVHETRRPLLKRGRPKKGSEGTTIKGNRGTPYLMARLLRDHPDVYARYQAGEFRSVHAAAKAAGLIGRQRPEAPATQVS